MARLLLADPDAARAAALAMELDGAGHATTVAASGLCALTMLEHGCAELLVTQDTVGDFRGEDLIAALRANPVTSRLPIVLLGGAADDADLVLKLETPIVALLGGIENVLAVHARGGVKSAAPSGLRGSLDVMDLPEVAQAIGLGGKTGWLSVTVPAGAGLLVFDAGRIIHAEHGPLSGERAFASLIRTARGGGQFCFTVAPRAAMRGVTRTVEGSVERLLLAVASDMDEGRLQPAGARRWEDR